MLCDASNPLTVRYSWHPPEGRHLDKALLLGMSLALCLSEISSRSKWDLRPASIYYPSSRIRDSDKDGLGRRQRFHMVMASGLAFIVQVVDDALLGAEVAHRILLLTASIQLCVSQGVVFSLSRPVTTLTVLWWHDSHTGGSPFKP